MVERRWYRGRVGLAAVLLCAGLLAGCDAAMTSMAQSMSESEYRAESARLEGQGNPQFSDPRLQAIVRDFETEYALYGRDAEKLKADATTLCPLAPGDAYRLLRGVSYEEQQAEFARHGLTSIVDLDSIEVRVVSGSCSAQGIEGPAEIVGSIRTIGRFGSGELERVTVTDSVERIRSTWTGGERRGPSRTIAISRSAQFEPGEAGALEAKVHDWAFLNEMAEAPLAIWTYASFGPDFATDPVVTFSRQPETSLFGTTLIERRADGTSYHRSYMGTELRAEGGTKDGKPHGWQIRHPHSWQGYEVAGGRDCYQNGELIKSTSCPAN